MGLQSKIYGILTIEKEIFLCRMDKLQLRVYRVELNFCILFFK